MLDETISMPVRDKLRRVIYDTHAKILKMHYRRLDFINQTTQPISFSAAVATILSTIVCQSSFALRAQ